MKNKDKYFLQTLKKQATLFIGQILFFLRKIGDFFLILDPFLSYENSDPNTEDPIDDTTNSSIDKKDLDSAVTRATEALITLQKFDGHWVFELEADSTIPAQYILFVHYLGETPSPDLERKIGNYLRRIQLPEGGWPMYTDGGPNISASVQAYFALKLIGDDENDGHMKRAREAILALGGVEMSNVFTRIWLVLYGVIPWSALPIMPVEIVLLPQWFPFHLSKISYWARTFIVPILVVMAKKPVAKNKRGVKIDELFIGEAEKVGLLPRQEHQNLGWFVFFRVVNSILTKIENLIPKFIRSHAIEKAVEWVNERLNGADGLGAIIPSMVNSVMMYDTLGYSPCHPNRKIARKSIENLLVVAENEAYPQSCLSPVWDTALASHALLETDDSRARQAVRLATTWLAPLQILEVRGDWAARRPNLRSGGWAFQYVNPYYPDVDDTAVVVMLLDKMSKDLGDFSPEINPHDRVSPIGPKDRIERAREWILGMQSRNGGWGAFEAENMHYYLNNIPFADHGALLDPPTVDVSARCLSMLSQLGETGESTHRALDYLLTSQEPSGSWYGRWGMNYIYGTWSALCALNSSGLSFDHPSVKKGARWLLSTQNPDGGWGESGDSYNLDYHVHKPAPSTPSQTAWALLGLLAAGKVDHPAVARGIEYLVKNQNENGLWDEERTNATGFPRVFYLHYHGYPKYFPLWALARYRNLKSNDDE